tara:strand:+ start:52 stop:2118 length:2067 start_codon:yes stop_codon:yes gene_type:complete
MENNNTEINIKRFVFTYLNHIKAIFIMAIFFVTLWIAYITFSEKIYEVKSLIQIQKNDQYSAVDQLLATSEDINLEEQIAIYISRSNIGDLVRDLKLNVKSDLDIDETLNLFNEVDYPFNFSIYNYDFILRLRSKDFDLLDRNNERVYENLLYDKDHELNGLKLNLNPIISEEEIYISLENYDTTIDRIRDSFLFSEIITSRFVNYGKSLINVSFIGGNVEDAYKILNTANNNFIQKDIKTKRESANTAIVFLEEQIKSVGGELELANDILNSFLESNDTFDINNETQFYADQFKQLTQQIQLIELQLAESGPSFKTSSTVAKKLIAQKQILTQQLEKINIEIKSLPKIQQDYLSLSKQADIKAILYENLETLKLEYSVRQASTIANVRVIDEAYFSELVAPKEFNALVLFFLLGFVSSIVYVVIFEIFFKRVNSVSDIIERFTSVNLLGALSLVNSKDTGDLSQNEEYIYDLEVISVAFDSALKKLDSHEKVFLITSATENAGKTSFSYEFSKMYSEKFNKKICVVDMDYKRGDLNEKFKKENLKSKDSIFLKGFDDFKVNDNLYFIPRLKKHSSKFMQIANSHEFFVFVEELKKEFDLILFDTTPVLGNSDSLTLLQHVSSIIFIVKHKVTKLSELTIALNNLDAITDSKPNIIYNFYQKESNYYGYNYSYSYKYDYKYRYTEKKE